MQDSCPRSTWWSLTVFPFVPFSSFPFSLFSRRGSLWVFPGQHFPGGVEDKILRNLQTKQNKTHKTHRLITRPLIFWRGIVFFPIRGIFGISHPSICYCGALDVAFPVPHPSLFFLLLSFLASCLCLPTIFSAPPR